MSGSGLPARFAEIKQEIAASYPDFKERATQAWVEILAQLKINNTEIAKRGTSVVPQVDFADLDKVSKEELENIRRRGTVVIKDVVDDAEAIQWRLSLEEFVKANPDVEGVPVDDKQFFQLYWTKSQVQARSHPNVLAATVWLNNLYHTKDDHKIDGVDLSTPLSYADRFRIRHPGVQWDIHPPHIDGGGIERWEDPNFRKCFSSILSGNWRLHDPYSLEGRLDARNSLYRRPNQSSIFRTFQGWLAMSETAPTQGTLKVFPNVQLSNAYLILRPFFRPVVAADAVDFLDAKNWELDISSPDFPGIYPKDGGYTGPRPTPDLHPHLQLEDTMTSVPKVNPGDTVFWHCDVIHSVEMEHTGTEASAVMYIPAVPLTPLNQTYIEKQRETFLRGQRPPDFPQGQGEDQFIGVGKVDDILHPVGRRAMGFQVAVA